jgi:hypothetical protein
MHVRCNAHGMAKKMFLANGREREAPAPLEMGAGAIGPRSGNAGQNDEPTVKKAVEESRAKAPALRRFEASRHAGVEDRAIHL